MKLFLCRIPLLPNHTMGVVGNALAVLSVEPGARAPPDTKKALITSLPFLAVVHDCVFGDRVNDAGTVERCLGRWTPAHG